MDFRPAKTASRAAAWTAILLLHLLFAVLLLKVRAPVQPSLAPVERITLVTVLPVAPKPPAAAAVQPAPPPPRLAASSRKRPEAITVPPAPAVAPAPPLPEAAPQATAPPAIDYALARETAAAVAREEAARTALHPNRFRVTPQTAAEQVGERIARTARSDCRSAYASLGPLALLALAKDAVTDKGCKW